MCKKIFAIVMSTMMLATFIPTMSFAGTVAEEQEFYNFRSCRIMSFIEPIKDSKYASQLDLTLADKATEELSNLMYNDNLNVDENKKAILNVISNLFEKLFNQCKLFKKASLESLKASADEEIVEIVDKSINDMDKTNFVYDKDISFDEHVVSLEKIERKCAVDINNHNLTKEAVSTAGSKKATFKSVAASKKKIKLHIKAIAIGENKVTKYQVYRSTSKNFKKGLKKYTVNLTDLSKSTLNYTDTKSLKKGAKYFYKVRGVITDSNGKPVYTKWSSAKSIKSK